MPRVSRKQQQLMGADLERARKGQKTVTGMTKSQLEDSASTPQKGLPTRKKGRKP